MTTGDFLGRYGRIGDAGPIKVKDMILAQAIEEKRRQDEAEITAFGGHLADHDED